MCCVGDGCLLASFGDVNEDWRLAGDNMAFTVGSAPPELSSLGVSITFQVEVSSVYPMKYSGSCGVGAKMAPLLSFRLRVERIWGLPLVA